MNRTLGALLILVGLVLLLAGVLLVSGTKLHFLGFLGKLPGDLRIEREGFRLYFPFASCLLVSVLLSLVLWLIGWLVRLR